MITDCGFCLIHDHGVRCGGALEILLLLRGIAFCILVKCRRMGIWWNGRPCVVYCFIAVVNIHPI